MAVDPTVYSIPPNRSFADSLAAGLIARYGRDPLALARGRILLPNTRAVRTVTEAFVRASGDGLVLPRLVAIGDPELGERIGGALDPISSESLPPVIEPLDRQLALASVIRRGGGYGAAEAMRLASDLARTLDQMIVEQVEPGKLTDIAADEGELAGHWQVSLDRLQAILAAWPLILEERGVIDLTDYRNRLLLGLARRWRAAPPDGFTVAAGITTAAPAIAALMRTVAGLPHGMVVLPAVASTSAMPAEEWDALTGGEGERAEETHPQFHLRLLLDRMGIAREEVKPWPRQGRSASPAVRSRVIVNAMTAAGFSAKWRPDQLADGQGLPARERRLTGVRLAELADPASEALAIAISLREALETPGRTAALVTPDRSLAQRVSAHLIRWGIEADDSAGRPLSQTPAGALLLGIAAAASERFAPVPLLALVKHPWAGGEGDQRQSWLRAVRRCDRALRGPRPPAGLAALDAHFTESAALAWAQIRPSLERIEARLKDQLTLAGLAAALREAAEEIAGQRAWSGPDGRAAAELVATLEASRDSAGLPLEPDEWVAVLRDLFDGVPVRPPYGGHPRLAIYGLLEARLQQSDLVILGGLNEGVWPALPSPDPWLAPRVRRELGLPGLEFRIGLSAHDFAGALGAPEVLITRARRDSKSPTVASRFLLRLQAMAGDIERDRKLERWVAAIDDPGPQQPGERPAPNPPSELRPKKISVTQVDRLKADPFAFYANAILGLAKLEPVDADHSAAWRGNAVHDVLQQWLEDSDCDPDDLLDRARALVAGDAIHPMLRALWQPRLLEAIDWIAGNERANRAAGRRPVAAEKEGKADIGGVLLYGRADRLDRLADGRLAIVDYKTGKPPAPKAVDEGFALQLGLLGLIAQAGGFEGITGEPGAHEYWSLARGNNRQIGFVQSPDQKIGSQEFMERTLAQFLVVASDYLTGGEPFKAKLNPAYAPYDDYDQLMRLEEWYGRERG